LRQIGSITRLLVGLATLLLAATVASLCAADAPLAGARKLFLTGKYAEATEVYHTAATAEGALGEARCQLATGQLSDAEKSLTAAVGANPKDARFPAELASLALRQGQTDAAAKHAVEALKLDGNQVLARYVAATLHRQAGRLDEADKAYHWFVDYYNANDVKDPESLRVIGLASAEFARWHRLNDQFGFLVNTFWPDLLEAEPDFWPAHYEAGSLYLEKYNNAEAQRELKAALALNPTSAEAYAGVAALAIQGFELDEAQAAIDQALEIDPQLLAAHQLQADIHLSNCEPQRAVTTLEAALKLNPVSEATLGRLAAAYLAIDGQPADEKPAKGAGTRFGKLVAEVTARNPHAGDFFMAVGDSFDKLRRYPLAAKYYQQTIEVMPQLLEPRGQAGMMLMRLGEEKAARKILDEAFEADPFNVRVSNTLKVLEVLDGYETLETAHFRIRFDPKVDKVLAKYAAAWLEEVYPQLCKQMGFTPPDKSLFEIFNKAKNTDGHGWFSARMVGLPHIHTIGACAGKMVAMQSPVGDEQKFNWARVLKHEFIHVLNLQQTNFNIPHWYTEALAVLNEGYPRPQLWNDLLVQRVAHDKLFNLDTINLGFIRAHSGEEWNLAYCQAELYAEYMLDRFGPDALAKMLAAYADNLTTREALRRAFGVEQEDFEKGYKEHVTKLVSGLAASGSAPDKTLPELTHALATDPKNPQLLAEMALAKLNRKAYPEARRLVDAARKIDPKQQLAAYVRARLHMVVGENKEALQELEAALDEKNPQENLLGLLAGLRLKSEDYAEAARLYELGAKRAPDNLKWTKSLAAVYLKSGEKKKLAEALSRLAVQDSEDLPVRKKLAELALANKDYAAAGDWARQAIQIDVMDEEMHRIRAEAAIGRHEVAEAVDEYAVAVELAPDGSHLRFGLAQAYIEAGKPAQAREALTELQRRDPKYPGTEELLESLK
jgi:tetratricopeptide (TPR) repeat protein